MTVKEELLNRFLGYVKVNTRSDESSKTVPSSSNQVAFLKTLGEELKELGLNNVRHEEDGYLFADLPANEADVKAPSLGFIAHIDTADFNSENIQPQIVKNYDGHSVIKLGQSGYELNPAVFPSLKKYENQTLITTDGNTLLGADDKAGVTEIVTLALIMPSRLMGDPSVNWNGKLSMPHRLQLRFKDKTSTLELLRA
ncbi:Di- or tripeptidase (PepD2) [Eupransor demetentiae]|uniref:Di- or tripeptidase (PepD2) n=1 Tax=Eupransor demetentiae TaxID=3109584 RepID=A0ABM9N3V7_9LACO|nr:Di- or tripeptidase (PepD2) [Lactobacillaceae bacterium LMG 33000]